MFKSQLKESKEPFNKISRNEKHNRNFAYNVVFAKYNFPDLDSVSNIKFRLRLKF